jgi:hypothetical protein
MFFQPSNAAGSAADSDRPDPPAVPGVHAPPHYVAAIVIIGTVVVGIVVGVVWIIDVVRITIVAVIRIAKA